MNKNIAWFDVETTGVNTAVDRVVQVALLITDKDGNIIQDVLSQLINPGIPIPAESSEIHGILDEHVSGQPEFKEIASGLFNLIKDCNFAGYNVAFDIQMLVREFGLCNMALSMSDRKIIDPHKVLVKMEPRDQSSVYKYYTGNTLEDAHDAKADILATFEIAKAQLAKYSGIDSITHMHDIAGFDKMCDLDSKIVLNDDSVPVFNFGPHHGKPITEELGFLKWMLGKDFSGSTKEWINKFLNQNGNN